MSFIQPCFIQKCTPKLIEKLLSLGYKSIGNCSELKFGIFCNNGKFKLCSTNEQPSIKDKDFIQCYDNEKLFLALAALRCDTPINSFYWFNRRLVKCEDKTEKHTFLNRFVTILKCRCIDDPNVWFGAEECFLRKATIEEIVEHFNN